MAEPDLPALRALRRPRRRVLADVEVWKSSPNVMNTLLGVFLGDHKAEHVAVKPLRNLLVGDSQIDVGRCLST
jgi:hypothetical protein